MRAKSVGRSGAWLRTRQCISAGKNSRLGDSMLRSLTCEKDEETVRVN